MSVSFPHSRGRRGSASRIRGSGEVQLPAFAGPVGVSFPHSEGRRGSASRIHGAGDRQLPAFARPERFSFPHLSSDIWNWAAWRQIKLGHPRGSDQEVWGEPVVVSSTRG